MELARIEFGVLLDVDVVPGGVHVLSYGDDGVGKAHLDAEHVIPELFRGEVAAAGGDTDGSGGPVGDEGAGHLDVGDKGVQVGVLVANEGRPGRAGSV